MGLAAMLYRTNLLALTSTTPPPAHAASRVTHSMHTAHHSLGGGGDRVRFRFRFRLRGAGRRRRRPGRRSVR